MQEHGPHGGAAVRAALTCRWAAADGDCSCARPSSGGREPADEIDVLGGGSGRLLPRSQTGGTSRARWWRPGERDLLNSSQKLRRGTDASLTLYLQHENPGGAASSNWLPALRAGGDLRLRARSSRADAGAQDRQGYACLGSSPRSGSVQSHDLCGQHAIAGFDAEVVDAAAGAHAARCAALPSGSLAVSPPSSSGSRLTSAKRQRCSSARQQLCGRPSQQRSRAAASQARIGPAGPRSRGDERTSLREGRRLLVAFLARRGRAGPRRTGEAVPLRAARAVLAGALESAPGRSSRYHLRRPWPNAAGATCLLLDPTDLLRRLAALVPAPYANLVRYHGVFAGRSRSRARLPRPPGKDSRRGCRAPIGAGAPGEEHRQPTLPSPRANTSEVAIPAAGDLHPQTPDAALGAASQTSPLPRRLVVSAVRRSDGSARPHLRAAGSAQDPPASRAARRPAAGGACRPPGRRATALR